MARITIVGSGASAVHFALSVLKKGHDVTMLDVGYDALPQVNPKDTYNELKTRLNDPVNYFLGENFESVVPPGYDKEIYGFPPNKLYIFKHPPGFREQSAGFEPLFSFAQGGLAQAWTGGAYPFNNADIKDFPFDYQALEPYYDEVCQRIGIIGIEDDLSRYYPLHKNLLAPLDFDEHSQLLVDRYQEKREKLIQKHGIYLGRSRVAALTLDRGERKACDYSGRCIWGCPTDSLYVPSLTLGQCREFSNFSYIPNRWVSHFRYDGNNRITTVVAFEPGQSQPIEYDVETLVLAAGTLSSSKIYLDSIFRGTGKILQLHGLMDNRQILVPFITLDMLGKNYNPGSYQYHQLAIGFEMEDGDYMDYVHGQVTTLKTALMQPVLQFMPLDWKTASFLGRNLHSAMGVINVNYSDTRRQENVVSIKPGTGNGFSTLEICYSPPLGEKKKISVSLKRVKKFFSALGAIVPPGQVHIRPMGASVHYSGTLPMSEKPRPQTLSLNCKSNDFENLYIVDGTWFPFLPAKNLTFTLMANAARVADKEF
ncbi:MAG: GMC family oxidoreductase [Candidatus Aminicenantes bacterium]|nr:MAG: GMC family oxidoreductase [Candidatus Aminicenantes bacterium]